jgi:hypothetical protein
LQNAERAKAPRSHHRHGRAPAKRERETGDCVEVAVNRSADAGKTIRGEENRLQSARERANSPRSQTDSCTTQPFQTRRKPNLESPSVCLSARSTGFPFERRTRHAGRDIFRLCRSRMAGAWQGARKDRLNLTGFVSAGKTTGFLSRGPWFYFSSFFFCWRCPRLVFGGALPLSLFSFSF